VMADGPGCDSCDEPESEPAGKEDAVDHGWIVTESA
jgi:hypothetical protein